MLATLLPIEAQEPETVLGGNEPIRRLAGLGLRYGGQYLPVTASDHDKFKARVEKHEAEMRKFVERWLHFLEEARVVASLRLTINNDGGAPAEDAVVTLRFPDPCSRAELPTPPKRPKRPEFQPRENPVWTMTHGDSSALLAALEPRRPIIPRFDPPNLNGPFYEDGSLGIRFSYPAIPHHEPLVTESFVVGIPAPGLYEAQWAVGAANLPSREEGTLELQLRLDEGDGTPINSLDALLDDHRKR